MDTSTLKEYVKNVYEIETALLAQRMISSYLDKEIYYARFYNTSPKKQLSENYREENWDITKIPIFILVPLAIIFFIRFGFSFLTLGIVVAITLISLLVCYLIDRKHHAKLDAAVRNELARLDQENKLIEQKNEKNRQAAMIQVQYLQEEKDIVEKSIEQAKQMLDSYYSLNIIHKNYRDLTAVSSFYQYLDSERCYQLTGPDGAYNKYEDELLHKQILEKLDTVVGRLDNIIDRLDDIQNQLRQIKGNQIKLYNGIKKGLDTLNEFRQYHLEIIQKLKNQSKSTEMIEWMTFYNTMTRK